MTDIVYILRHPPFGTETSERNIMARAADEIERLRNEDPKKYLIGENTMEKVFRPAGLENVSDLQAVFDAVEKALSAIEPVAEQ